MIFTRGDYLSVKIVCDALSMLGHVSGLKANCLKSNILLASMDDLEKSRIFTLIRFPCGFSCLGISLAQICFKVADFSPLLDKVSNTLQSWVRLDISYAGRLEVVRTVVRGIESFWLGILPIFVTVLEKITSFCRRFLSDGK